MKNYIVYMTAKDVSEARTLGRAILKSRLAACVNILGPMESMYWWKGAVQNEKEVALIAKTTARSLDALIRKVLSIHSYDVPCVVAFPIAKGNPAFLRWIEKETQRVRLPGSPIARTGEMAPKRRRLSTARRA
jgi:periplasmic divalent cation tolerance protein